MRRDAADRRACGIESRRRQLRGGSQVVVDGPIQIQALLRLEQHQRGGREGLCDRRRVVHRVRRRGDALLPVGPAERFLPDDAAVSHHCDCDRRNGPFHHQLADCNPPRGCKSGSAGSRDCAATAGSTATVITAMPKGLNLRHHFLRVHSEPAYAPVVCGHPTILRLPTFGTNRLCRSGVRVSQVRRWPLRSRCRRPELDAVVRDRI